jgi:hypothetical protein
MSMHMIRGVQVHGKSKINRKPGWKQRQEEHEAYLKSLGVTGKKSDYRYEIPDYKTGPRVTSDKVAGNGAKKESMRYTGDEIMGIVDTHKSNAMPIRKDNKQAAVDAAQMRRS